jgi:hypothetical protein
MRTVAVIAIAFTVAATCGCGSLPLIGKSKSAKRSADVAEREPNPFHTTAAGSSTPDSRDAPPLDSGSRRADVAASRDEDTTRLQAEIADLPPDKQRAILKEWRQIEPSMRPSFLQVIHSQRLLRATRTASAESSRTRLADHEDRAGSRENERGPFADDPSFDPARPRNPHRRGRRSDPAGRPGARNPAPDEREVPDQFRSKEPRRLPDESADRNPLPDPQASRERQRPESPGPRGADPIAAGQVTATSAEPFSPEWHRALQRLVELSDAAVAKEKTPDRKRELSYIRRQVYLRMLYLLSGKTTQAVQAIPHIEAADQEFWQKTMWGISAYLDDRSETDRRSRATQTITRFNEAVEHLRAEADLVVKNVVFCRKIDSFGSYDKLAKAEFRPGEQVLVYAEIENFKTELTPEGRHRTRLKSEIELFQKIGSEYRESKQKFDFPPTEDVCRSYRRDYFHSYILTLPQSLGLGDYVLKLTVTDHVGNKIGSDTVQFTVK